MKNRGACFLKDLSKLTGLLPAELLSKLERLVWSRIITNDAYSVARYYIDMDRKNSPWVKYNKYPNMGRWYIVDARAASEGKNGLWTHINRMLDRYGVISKDGV